MVHSTMSCSNAGRGQSESSIIEYSIRSGCFLNSGKLSNDGFYVRFINLAREVRQVDYTEQGNEESFVENERMPPRLQMLRVS